MKKNSWYQHYKKTTGVYEEPEKEVSKTNTGRCGNCNSASFRLMVMVGKGILVRSCKRCSHEVIVG